METILNVLSVLGGLAMFLYGMALMSDGLQKSAGDRLRAFMAKMTSNAFKRVLTGTVVTCLVQSSSATTIMVVSFVNAGLLTLGNAIGVIMGANIGTTLTAWITSLGFSVNIALFAVPMMAFGYLMHSSKKATLKNVGQFLMGFAVMYVGLTFMKDCSNAILGEYQTGMMNFFGSINGFGFGSILLFLIAGAVLTIVLQASSATMAITMLLAASGLIDFKLAVAMVLGENIGTTITANIAAAVANTSAKRAARAHTIFNIIGVIWVLCIFGPIVKLICVIMESLNFYDPMMASSQLAAIANGSFQADAETIEMYKNSLLYGIAMLHTLFNITNTLVLIWFVPLIEKAVVNESNNGTAKGIGLVINGAKVGKAKDCSFKGETYGITLHLKGVFAAGLELENCKVEGTTASIYAWDEKGIYGLDKNAFYALYPRSEQSKTKICVGKLPAGVVVKSYYEMPEYAYLELDSADKAKEYTLRIKADKKYKKQHIFYMSDTSSFLFNFIFKF